LHLHAAYPYWLPMLHVYVACLCCIFMLHVHVSSCLREFGMRPN
jgi:hypothetical protein